MDQFENLRHKDFYFVDHGYFSFSVIEEFGMFDVERVDDGGVEVQNAGSQKH